MSASENGTRMLSNEELPIYNGEGETKCQDGLYLGLFHGRNTTKTQMDDWGFNGPLIGPLRYVHTTYGSHIKFEFTSVEAHDKYFPHCASSWNKAGGVMSWRINEDFVLTEDMISYRGKFYGDWSIFVIEGGKVK